MGKNSFQCLTDDWGQVCCSEEIPNDLFFVNIYFYVGVGDGGY